MYQGSTANNADAAEASVRTLTAHVVSKQWYALAEKLNIRTNSIINNRPPAGWKSQAHPRWDQFAAALVTDAAAVPVSA